SPPLAPRRGLNGGPRMATTAAATFTPDRGVEVQLLPGMLEVFRATLAEAGPRIKCYKGSLTLVSPGETHGSSDSRVTVLIVAVCTALKIPMRALTAGYFRPPGGGQDS